MSISDFWHFKGPTPIGDLYIEATERLEVIDRLLNECDNDARRRHLAAERAKLIDILYQLNVLDHHGAHIIEMNPDEKIYELIRKAYFSTNPRLRIKPYNRLFNQQPRLAAGWLSGGTLVNDQ
ncbi:MAG: hypothetical protein ACOYK8_02420 [Alphaproteobacteria bacterium]